MNSIDYCKKIKETAWSYEYCDAKMLGAFSFGFLSKFVFFHEYSETSIVKYTFDECYNICFSHIEEEIKNTSKRKWKPSCYTFSQIDYFIQDISFSLKREGENDLFECNIDIAIAKLYILCGNITIQLKKISELTPMEREMIVLPDN